MSINTAVSSLSIPDIEQALMMWEWGKWLCTNSPGGVPRCANVNWIFRMKEKGRGIKQNRFALIGEIDPIYAVKLDGMIAKLPPVHKDILLNTYAYHHSLREMETDMDISKNTIAQHRDYSLCFLYGQLKNS